MNSILPFRLERLLEAIGPHERLPLTDAGLDGRPLAWVRIKVSVTLEAIQQRTDAAGCRSMPARRGHRTFLLVHADGGDRLEIDGIGDGPRDGADVFAEAVDRAIQARRAGSSITCWQGSNDAIAALLTMVVDTVGGPTSPEGLPVARAVLPQSLRDALRTLRTGLNLRDSLNDLRRILVFADGVADWLGDRGGVALAAHLVRLRPRLEADRFQNLRDVADWWAPHIRPGVLLRGRSPAVYDGEGFWKYAEDVGLRRFVDLRGAVERTRAPYPSDVDGCAHCPVGSDPAARTGVGDLDSAYRRIPLACGPALKGVLEAIAGTDGPALVHCHAGVDRTGVVVAILGTWLGVPRERIFADYLASGQLVDARRLESALEVAAAEGVDALIASSGVTQAVLERARARLLA